MCVHPRGVPISASWRAEDNRPSPDPAAKADAPVPKSPTIGPESRPARAFLIASLDKDVACGADSPGRPL